MLFEKWVRSQDHLKNVRFFQAVGEKLCPWVKKSRREKKPCTENCHWASLLRRCHIVVNMFLFQLFQNHPFNFCDAHIIWSSSRPGAITVQSPLLWLPSSRLLMKTSSNKNLTQSQISKWANADVALHRYIGLLSNITFDLGVKENSQTWKTSERAKSFFSQVGSTTQILKEKIKRVIFRSRRTRWKNSMKFTKMISHCLTTTQQNL